MERARHTYRNICNSPPYLFFVSSNHSRLAQPTLQDCQRVLRVSQVDMLDIHRKLLDQKHVEEDQRTLFRYFCEAILVLRYFQRPEAVKAFKVSTFTLQCFLSVYEVSHSLCSLFVFQASDWINKRNVDGGIHMEVQSTKQSATFSLTEEDSAVSSLTGFLPSIFKYMVNDTHI